MKVDDQMGLDFWRLLMRRKSWATGSHHLELRQSLYDAWEPSPAQRNILHRIQAFNAEGTFGRKVLQLLGKRKRWVHKANRFLERTHRKYLK